MAKIGEIREIQQRKIGIRVGQRESEWRLLGKIWKGACELEKNMIMGRESWSVKTRVVNPTYVG